MLLGVPGVKPDRMIKRFVGDALGRANVPAEECSVLLHQVANNMGVDATRLDHAIWSYQRTRR